MGISRTMLLALFLALAPMQVLAQGREAGPDNLMLDKRIAPARARVEALRKTLEEYRDHPSEGDFKNMWVRDNPAAGAPPRLRRVPTQEFQARVADTEAKLRAAEAELSALERSLY
jgi:hypothetical protein